MAFQGAKVVKKIFMAKCLPVIFFLKYRRVRVVTLLSCWRPG